VLWLILPLAGLSRSFVRALVIAMTVCILVTPPPRARADEAWTGDIVEEDDFWAPNNRDRHYTHGIRFSATSGNSVKASASVDKLPLVGHLETGLAGTWGHWRLAYTYVYRSQEFVHQNAPDHYGSLNLAFRASF